MRELAQRMLADIQPCAEIDQDDGAKEKVDPFQPGRTVDKGCSDDEENGDDVENKERQPKPVCRQAAAEIKES